MQYAFKTRPYKHQLVALKKALAKGCIALFMEMGTGKTKVAIDFAACVALKEGGRVPIAHAAVVAPLSVLGVWEEQIKEHDPYGDNDYMGVQYRIINYDRIFKPSVYDALVEWLEEVPYNQRILIGDESHRFKRHSTRRAKAMYRLAKHCGKRIIMTGTPITNRGVLDLFAQFKVVNWSIFGTVFEAFKIEYTAKSGYKGFRRVLRRAKKRKLQRKISPYTVVVKKDDCFDLPPRKHVHIPIRLGEQASRVYREMADECVAEISGAEISAPNILTRIMRLQQITGGWIKDPETEQYHRVGTEKVAVYADLINTMSENERQKVVVYCRFLNEINDVSEVTKRAGYEVLTVQGSNRKDRERTYKAFAANKHPTVLVCQIATGALGRNELVVAREAIFYSCDFSFDNFDQALDRLHRPGQKHKVTYYHLLAIVNTGRQTVDHTVLASLREHRSLAKMVLKIPSLLYNRSDTEEEAK